MTKIQFNQSTALLHFTADTKKAQTTDGGGPCSECADFATIDVTISDLITCCSVAIDSSANSVSITPSIADLFNGTHTLTRLSKCIYSKPIDVSPLGTYNYFYYFDSDDCSTTPAVAEPISQASITVNLLSEPGAYFCSLVLKGTGSIPVQAQRWTDPIILPCWDQTIDPSVYPVCGIDGGFLFGVTNILAGGTLVISETP